MQLCTLLRITQSMHVLSRFLKSWRLSWFVLPWYLERALCTSNGSNPVRARRHWTRTRTDQYFAFFAISLHVNCNTHSYTFFHISAQHALVSSEMIITQGEHTLCYERLCIPWMLSFRSLLAHSSSSDGHRKTLNPTIWTSIPYLQTVECLSWWRLSWITGPIRCS